MSEFSSARAIFNLYETTSPAPGYQTFLEGVKHTFAFVEKEPSFVIGQFHQNLDPEGLFKFAHYASFRDGSFQGFSPNPSPEWHAAIKEGHGEWGHQIRHPGGYSEIATWSGEPWCPKPQAADNSIFLLATFKDVPGDFEADWKTRSGATIISQSLPSDVTMHQAGLFRKLGGPTPFNYILRCELLPLSTGEGAAVKEVLGSLSDIRDKLSGAGVPVTNISVYHIFMLTKPVHAQ